MGFVQKVVGSITGANKQAKAIQAGAEEQAAATRQAASSAADAARQSAQQTATMQASSAARNAAVSESAELLSKPVESADVQIDVAPSSGEAKKRREKFGIGSAGVGVNI